MMVKKKKMLISALLSASVLALYSCGGGGGGTSVSENTGEIDNQPEVVEIPEITSANGTASIKFGDGIILQKIYKNGVSPQAQIPDTTVIVPHEGTDQIKITVNDPDDNLVIMDATVQNPDATSNPLAEHTFFGVTSGGQISSNPIQAVYFTENSAGELVPNKIEHKVVEINIDNDGTGTLEAKFAKPSTDNDSYEGKDFVFQNLSLFNKLAGQTYSEDQNGTTVNYEVLDRGDYFENFTVHFNDVIDLEAAPSQNSSIYIDTTNDLYEIPPNATSVGIKFVDKDNNAKYDYSTYVDPNDSTTKIDIVSSTTVHDISITSSPGSKITISLTVNECLKADTTNNTCLLTDTGTSEFTVYQDVSMADSTGLTANCFDPRTEVTTSNVGDGGSCTFSEPADSNAGTITLNIPSYYSDNDGNTATNDPLWNGYCKVVVEYPGNDGTEEDAVTTADVLCSELGNQTLSWNVPASFKGLGNQSIAFSIRKKYTKLDTNNTEIADYIEIDRLDMNVKVNQSPTFGGTDGNIAP